MTDFDDGWSTGTFRDVFRDRLSNNPAGWTLVADFLDGGANLIKGNLIVGVEASVRTAEEVAAHLFCAYVAAKQEHIEIGFHQMVDSVTGKSFGARLINWILAKIDIDIADDLKVAWSGFHQQMSSTIEMMIKDLLDDPEMQGLVTSPEQAKVWISRRGGMGKLHMEFMNYRRTESQREKGRKEADRLAGAEARRKREAEEAGFASVSAFQTHQAETARTTRERKLRNKFDELKQQLIRNGTLVESVPDDLPKDGSLLIVSQGVLYTLSDEDEYTLLSCGAAALV